MSSMSSKRLDDWLVARHPEIEEEDARQEIEIARILAGGDPTRYQFLARGRLGKLADREARMPDRGRLKKEPVAPIGAIRVSPDLMTTGTKRQKAIWNKVRIEGYTSAEVARATGVSRQAVNRVVVQLDRRANA